MKTNIVVSLDTRRKKQDGLYPLIMRLGHNERTTSIPLGIDLPKKDWDDENRVVKKSYTGVNTVSRLNNLIQKKKADAMDVIFKLHETGQLHNMTITDLKERVVRQGKSTSFYTYTEKLIEELKTANRIGTARSYKGVKSVLKSFHGEEKELYFNQITYPFLTRFEAEHRGKGNGANGLAVYMRTIRAIFNKAIKAGFVEKESYPFDDYKIKTTPTQKRALEWEYMQEIIALKLDPDDSCFNARNYFLASYMMYGMNFKDMAYLRKDDIKGGRVQYKRKKTGKEYDIKITEGLQVILNHYSHQNHKSEYIFPILKRATPILQERDVQWARKGYNKKLKDLADLCGIKSNLTSYVSRHSFATQAMLRNVPINAISAMLGHSSVKTTEVYLKGLPSNVLDDYNIRILEMVKSDFKHSNLT